MQNTCHKRWGVYKQGGLRQTNHTHLEHVSWKFLLYEAKLIEKLMRTQSYFKSNRIKNSVKFTWEAHLIFPEISFHEIRGFQVIEV